MVLARHADHGGGRRRRRRGGDHATRAADYRPSRVRRRRAEAGRTGTARPRQFVPPPFSLESDDASSRRPAWESRLAARENRDSLSRDMQPGRYRVRVQNSPTGWMFKAAMLNGVDVSETPFEFTRDVTDLVLTFTDRWSGMSGVVQGAGGGGAMVLAFTTNVQTWNEQGASPRRLKSTRANARGEFGISSVPPGDYYVVAVPEEQAADWRDPKALEALARLATQVTIAEGEHKTIDLRLKDSAPVIGKLRSRSRARDDRDAGAGSRRATRGLSPRGRDRDRQRCRGLGRSAAAAAAPRARHAQRAGARQGRTAITADDGSFAFDRVTGRTRHAGRDQGRIRRDELRRHAHRASGHRRGGRRRPDRPGRRFASLAARSSPARWSTWMDCRRRALPSRSWRSVTSDSRESGAISAPAARAGGIGRSRRLSHLRPAGRRLRRRRAAAGAAGRVAGRSKCARSRAASSVRRALVLPRCFIRARPRWAAPRG